MGTIKRSKRNNNFVFSIRNFMKVELEEVAGDSPFGSVSVDPLEARSKGPLFSVKRPRSRR